MSPSDLSEIKIFVQIQRGNEGEICETCETYKICHSLIYAIGAGILFRSVFSRHQCHHHHKDVDIWMFEKRRSVKQKASAKLAAERRYHVKARSAKVKKKLCTLLDLCVSSLRRGHANLLCIVPILTDDPRRVSRRRK